MASAGPGEEHEHQVTAMAVRTMTPEVAVGKSPNAIPEFWTW